MKTPFYSLLLLCALGSSAQTPTRLYPFSDGNHWGLTNENRDVLAPPQFDTSFMFTNNGYAIVRKDGRYGTIDQAGKTMVACSYDGIKPIKDDLGSGRQSGKSVLLNLKTGKQLSPLPFDKVEAYCFCELKVVAVAIGSKDVLVNTITGRQLGKGSYDEVRFFQGFDTRAAVKTSGKYGLISIETGAWVIPAKYERIELTRVDDKDVLEVSIGGVIAYKDGNGKDIKSSEPGKTQGETTMEERVMSVEEPAKAGENDNKDLYVYNLGNGNWKLTLEQRGYNRTQIVQTFEAKGYSAITKLSYNPYAKTGGSKLKAVKDGRTGIIDLNGNILTPFQYDNIEYDSRYGLLKTTLDGKIGILNKDLLEIKRPALKRIIDSDYSLDAWLVEMPGGQKGYMNRQNGKIYIPGIAD